MQCEIFSFRGSPALGISTNTSYFNKVLLVYKYYPSNTIKKFCFKFIVIFILLFGLGNLFFSPATKSLNNAIKSLNSVSAPNVLIRFHSLSKKSRCYCFFSDSNCDLQLFSKLAFDNCNSNLLKKECLNINKINTPDFFYVPQIINQYERNGLYGFSLSPIPKSYYVSDKSTPFLNANILSSIQGEIHLSPLSIIQEQTWWPAFNNVFSKGHFVDFDSLLLARVHGDLGSENLLLDINGELPYIIDWERTHQLAPYLTDALAYWLGHYHKEILGDNDIDWLKIKFHNEFINYYKCKDSDAYAALCFLSSIGFDLAVKLLGCLKGEK